MPDAIGVSGPVPVLLMVRSLGHGGSERQAAVTALGLNREQFAPHVACVEEGFHFDAMRKAGLPTLVLPLNSFVNRTAWQSARALWQYVHRHRIRLIHTFDHTLTVLGIPVGKLSRGTRTLSSQRGYFDVIPSNHLRLLHGAHRIADSIVVNCEALRRDMVDRYGYRAERIEVCYNGIDLERFYPRERRRLPGLEAASLVVGVVCVQRPEKNLSLLMRAFARVRVRHAGLMLLLVGSGPERESLEHLAVELGVREACVFRPSTPEVPEALASIDVFVHPSSSEALPNAVMEAMACGCCVLSSEVGGCPEIIRHGESGLLFGAGDEEKLVELLGEVIGNQSLRHSMAKVGAEHIAAVFSIDKCARRMEEIYRRTLQAREAR